MSQDHEKSYALGGPLPWFSATLSVSHEQLDPQFITDILGIPPDRSTKRGVAAKSRTGRKLPEARLGMWTIEVPRNLSSELDIAGAINNLLTRVEVPEELWLRALMHCPDASARIFLGLRLDSFNRGFSLPSAIVQRLARRHLTLDFDLYASGPEDLFP